MTKQQLTNSLTVLGLVVFMAAGAFIAYGAGVAPDVAIHYTPLVRHQISQKHCYDIGSQDCEKRGFTKEFSLGYLFRPSPYGVPADPLYLCSNHGQLRYHVTKERAECHSMGLKHVSLLGYITLSDQLESPAPLYRCLNADSGDTLLTDDSQECVLAGGYGPADFLGYLAGSGLR